MDGLRIDYIPISEITPYKYNARKHQEADISAIKASIEEFGFLDALGVWGKDNIIVEGHGRYRAAKELGYNELPVVHLDWLTDEQRRAYALAHNKTAELSEWDPTLLDFELSGISDIDMSSMGFIYEDEQDTDPEPNDDDFDIDQQVEAVTQPGDMFRLGDHILICGDSSDESVYSRLLGRTKADLICTDPPYNVAVSNSDGMTIQNDNMNTALFYDFLKSVFEPMAENIKQGGSFYIWYGASEQENFERACRETGLSVRQQLIWVKNSFTFGRQDYKWQHEPCLYGWKEGAAHYFAPVFNEPTVIDDAKIEDFKKLRKDECVALLEAIFSKEETTTTVIREDKPLKDDLHPTMKPVTLFGRLIKNSTTKGQTVLDPFGGSGTTVIACEQLKRKARVIELDPHYCDVIIARWEQFTGGVAEKL